MLRGLIGTRRTPVTLVVLTLLLYQSHWLDDAFTDEPDAAGIIVSAIGSAAVLAILVAPRSFVARVAGVLGLGFIALISVADLVGLQQDGSRAEDIVMHWRNGLGWPLSATVAATLVCAVASLIALRRRRSLRGST
jgi:hypothetical protein